MKSKVVSDDTAQNNTVLLNLQVPLGVLLFNENKTDQMCSIMKSLHNYVPKKTYKLTYHLPDEDFTVNEDFHHRILLGGDQLTVCRTRGARLARSHDDEPTQHFDGFIPVAEDWHTRMTMMRVSVYRCCVIVIYINYIGYLETTVFQQVCSTERNTLPVEEFTEQNCCPW